MKLSSAIQEALVALLCFDDSPGGGKLVAGLVPTTLFDPYFTELASSAVEYTKQYDQVPGEHTLDLVNTLKARSEESAAEIYDRLYVSLIEVKDSINREYVIKQARNFIRFQNIRKGVGQAIDLLKNEDESALDQIDQVLRGCTETSLDLFDPGTNFFDPQQSLKFLYRDETDSFPTGIPELDYYEMGPARGRLHLYIAGYGTGKSWWLQNLARRAHMNRKRVLYVTCEMSEADVCQRLAQSYFSITKREQTVAVPKFIRDELGRFTQMGFDEVRGRPFLNSPGIHQTLMEKFGALRRTDGIRVKFFPSGTLTIPQLEGFMSSLEATNFIPDLLILDYADLMHIRSPQHTRQELHAIYVDLRGIAGKRNIGVATATQTNREGLDARVVRGKHAAEDISKLHTADIALTYNQTPAEKALNLARLFVDKGRMDQDKFTVLISQAYAMGQFVMDSSRMSDSTYWNVIDEHSQQTNPQ